MKKNILIVDDHGDLRRLIRMTLEFDDYHVIEASNGQEGLDLARQHKPDIIMLDIMMPGMSGIDVSKTIQADPVLQSIPVVMLTALDRPTDIAAGRNAGAVAYIVKPFSPFELLDTLASLLKS